MNPHCCIGTSGWVYPHWRGVFYPPDLAQSRWYGHYAKVFDTVEINYSFYRLPSEAAFDRWREQAPEGFVYAVKANRYITHVKRLKDTAEPLERFLARARRLGDKLGPILWQLPPHWRANPERLETFVALLPPDLTHAFEFRDPRWFIEPVRRILEQHRLSLCIFHMPGLPCPTWVTGDVVYLRFHGSGVVYGGRYGREGLQPWATRIRRWLSEGRQVYAYFNNDAFGFAVEDARALRELVESAPA
nr:DUF72 domain-containing protein [Anaerolineae bacterium]